MFDRAGADEALRMTMFADLDRFAKGPGGGLAVRKEAQERLRRQTG